jgi:hypothetical protein
MAKNVPILCGLCGPKRYMCSLPIQKEKTLSCTVQGPGALCGGQPKSFDKELYSDYSDDARVIAEVYISIGTLSDNEDINILNS